MMVWDHIAVSINIDHGIVSVERNYKIVKKNNKKYSKEI